MNKVIVIAILSLMLGGCLEDKKPSPPPKPTPQAGVVKPSVDLNALYQKYRTDRDALFQEKKWEALIELSPELLSLTKALDKPSSYAWQLNNSGLYFIELFKERTNYATTSHNLLVLTGLARRELRDKFKEQMRDNIGLIQNAKSLLLNAYKMNSELPEVDEKCTATINSNLSFVSWIENFTGIAQ